jgi:hypothetical protein
MISGRAFAELCQWVVEPRYPDLPRYTLAARNGDRVFLNGDLVYAFVPKMFKKHVFIVHNSDQPFDEPKLRALLPYAHHIYAANTTVHHSQLTTIPLGFADKQVAWAQTFRPTHVPRNIRVYANFLLNTNPVKRQECLDAAPSDAMIKSGVPLDEYRSDLCASRFVLCPEGTGMDTHRVYEALLCGATPVVLRSALTPLYANYPICVVDSWTDAYVEPPSRSVQFRAAAYIR